MKRETKKNRLMIGVFTALYVIYAVCLFWFHPFVASAKEPVPGGKGNTVTVSGRYVFKDGKVTRIEETLVAKDDCEIIGCLTGYSNDADYILYCTLWVLDSKGLQIIKTGDYLADCTGFQAVYDKSGEILSSDAYTLSFFNTHIYYESVGQPDPSVNTTISGLKIFEDSTAMNEYAKTGSLDGMINDDVDVDSGSYDKEIGYLHNLKHHALMYGEEDENGLTSSFDERFTWSDYYPEYDDSYMVEVRASCEVEVKKWFGIGKSTLYNSDIRELAHGVKYKDLQYIISLADEKSVFADFLNEYMPGNSSVSDVISAATYQFDAYYFRIYRWDEEEQTYKYGLWVRLTKNGTALTGSLKTTVDAGTIDKDGNWKQDPSSDYGEGKEDTTITGKGDTLDDAKNEADQKQEDKDNGIKDIDLSNTNFKELWEWFTGCLVSFWEGLGVIPDFFGRIFSFLPAPVIGFVALAIVAAIILRVIGR